MPTRDESTDHSIGRYESVLPPGLIEEFSTTGDVEAAYVGLAGDHWFVDGMRGRFASLLLRTHDAETHFRRAAERWSKSRHQDGDNNLRRAFLVSSFHVENDLIRGEAQPRDAQTQLHLAIQGMDAALDRAIGRYVVMLGYACLHLGEDIRALELFDESRDHCQIAELLGVAQVGEACAHFNLGEAEAARDSLLEAEFAYQITRNALNATALAAQLSVTYAAMGLPEDGAQWESRVTREENPIPAYLKPIFVRRAQLIADQCREKGRLVMA